MIDMFDFLRNLGRPKEEKQQEILSAYLDGELTPAERDRLEQQLGQDNELRDMLAQMQFWQQQMRDLPARRVPRNFTLDPALYGRPQQRQFLGNAYPALRTATALTAFLLVIALAANVYMSSLSPGAPSQMALSPMLETAPTLEMAEGETMPAEITRVVTETAVEEEIAVEVESAEEEMAAELPPAEPPATPFALETTVDKETEAAEAPVEIAGAEEAPPANAITEEALEEPAAGEREELLTEELRQDLSQSLDLLEETAEPLDAPASEALPATVDGGPVTDEAPVEVAPPAPSTSDLEEQPLSGQQPPVLEDQLFTPLSRLPVGFEAIVLGLGLLFIILTTLTIIARGRR